MEPIEEEFFKRAQREETQRLAREEALQIAAEKAANPKPQPHAELIPAPKIQAERSQENKERLIWQGSPSQVCCLGTYILCGCFCWLIVPVFIAAWEWLKINTSKYEITTHRIRVQSGVFQRVTSDIELYRVRDISLVEPFLLRMFGLGNIVLEAHEGGSEWYMLEGLSNAAKLREKIRQSVEACRERKGVRVLEL